MAESGVPRVQISISITPPPKRADLPAPPPSVVILKPEDFDATIKEITSKHELGKEEKEALIAKLLEHSRSGFKVEIKESFSGPEEYLIYLSYAKILISLGYQVKLDGKDKELSGSLLLAIKAYTAKKIAEGFELKDGGGYLTGTLLLLLARDYQLNFYGDTSTIASAQSQVVTGEADVNDNAAMIKEALIKFKFEKGLLGKIKSQAEEKGFEPPNGIGDADNYEIIRFYSNLLISAGYPVELKGEDLKVLASLKAAIAKFNSATKTATPGLSSKAIIKLLGLFSKKMEAEKREELQGYITEWAPGISSAMSQFEAVTQGKIKIAVIYDEKTKKIVVVEIKGQELRVVPLEGQAVVKVLLGLTGSDPKELALQLVATAKKDFKQFNTAFQVAGQLCAQASLGKIKLEAIGKAQEVLGSRFWPYLKKQITKKDGGSEPLLARINKSSTLRNIMFSLGIKQDKINEALMTASALEKGRGAAALIPKIKKIHEELGISYPIKIEGKKGKLNDETYNVYLTRLAFELPEELAKDFLSGKENGRTLVAIIDSKGLKGFFRGREINQRLFDNPEAISEEDIEGLGLNKQVILWQAKIQKFLEEDREPEEINNFIKLVFQDKKLWEKKKLIAKYFVQIYMQKYSSDEEAESPGKIKKLEELIAHVKRNSDLKDDDRKDMFLVMYEAILGTIESDINKKASSKLPDDMEPKEKRKRANVEAGKAVIDYLKINKAAIISALGAKNYLALKINRETALIKEQDGVEKAAEYIKANISEYAEAIRADCAKKHLSSKRTSEILTKAIKELQELLDPPKTLARIIKVLREARTKALPDKGLPSYEFALPKFKHLKIVLNAKRGEVEIAKKRLIRLFAEASKIKADLEMKAGKTKTDHDRDAATSEPDLGIKIFGDTIEIAGLGQVEIVAEEISDGSDWAKDTLHRKLNERETRAQTMLRELGYLKEKSDMAGISSIDYEGSNFYFVAVSGVERGRYCYATMQAMGQFNATAFNKGDKEKIDARLSLENLDKLEEIYKRMRSSKVVVGVLFERDARHIDPKMNVVSHTINGIKGDNLLEDADPDLLLDIARKLSIVRTEGQPYLSLLNPEIALTTRGSRAQLAKAIVLFYSQNIEKITGRKPDAPNAVKNKAKEISRDPKRLNELADIGRNMFESQSAQRLIPNEADRIRAAQELSFVCIDKKFLEVLDKAYSRYNPKEAPKGMAALNTSTRSYSPLDSADLARHKPFARLMLRVRQAQGIPEGGYGTDFVSDVLTIDDLIVIRNLLNPYEKDKALRPYIHILLDNDERETLRSNLDKIKDEELALALRKLIVQSKLDPTKQWNIDDRIELNSEEIKLLYKFISEIKASDSKLHMLLLHIKNSHYADVVGKTGDYEAVSGLIEWMKANPDVKYLDPKMDFSSTRSADKAYMDGIKAIRRLSVNAMGAVSFGAGVKVVQGPDSGWKSRISDIPSRIAASAGQILHGRIDPNKGALGVGGVEEWKLVKIKIRYLREMGLDVVWKGMVKELKDIEAELVEIKTNKDKYQSWTMMEQFKRAKELLERKEFLESRLNSFISGLSRIDSNFFDWFCSKYAKESAVEKGLNIILDVANRRFFEAKGFKSPFGGQQITLAMLKRAILAAKNDPELMEKGWSGLTPISEDNPTIADAKQAMALLITLLPQGDDGSVEAANPVTRALKIAFNAMLHDETPPFNIGADLKSLAIMLTQNIDERNDLLLHNIGLKPNEVDKRFALAFAKVFEEVCTISGTTDYSATIAELKILAQKMGGSETLSPDSNNLRDDQRYKLLLDAVFLINIMLGKKQLGKEGLTVADGAVDKDTKLDKKKENILTALGLQVLTKDFWEEVFRKGSDKAQGPDGVFFKEGALGWADYIGLTPVSELVGTFGTFGAFMGAYFGIILPYNLVHSGVRWIRGDEIIDIDPKTGLPKVDEKGHIKTRKIELIRDVITDKGLNLVVTLLIFRSWAPAFYNMLGVWDDLREGHWYRAYIKMNICNFFLLMPGKNGFVDSGIGRTFTIDRYLWKSIFAVKDWLMRMDKIHGLGKGNALGRDFGGLVSDEKMEAFYDYFNKHPALKKLIMGLKAGERADNILADLPDKGLLGSICSEFSKTSPFRWVMEKLGTGTVAGKIATLAHMSLDPMGVLLKISAENANESRTAAGIQKALNKLFEYSFEKTRATYWEGKAVVWVADKWRKRSAYRAGGKTEAGREGELRARNQSENALGNLFAQLSNSRELIVRVEGDGINARRIPVVGDFSSGNQWIIDGVLRKIPAVQVKGIDKLLKVTRVHVDSPEALTAQHWISYAIVRPSLATPLEMSEIELHINSGCFTGNVEYDEKTIEAHAKELTARARYLGIDDPQMKRDKGLLRFEEVREQLNKAGIEVEANIEVSGVLDGSLKEEGVSKLIEFCSKKGIKKVDDRSWLDIKAELAKTLIEKPEVIGAEKSAQMIFDAAGELVEGVDYTIEEAKEAAVRRRIELTEAGRNKIERIVGENQGKADFVVCRSLEDKVKVYLEAEKFSETVMGKDGLGDGEVVRLQKLTRKEFAAEIERFYTEAKGGKMTYSQSIRAARFAAAAVYIVKNGAWTFNKRQLQAGYLASLNIKGGDKIRNAIDLGTGEGKTVTLTLPEFFRALCGDKLVIATSTTETYASDGYRSTKDILALLGIRAEFVASKNESDLLKALKMAATGRTVVYTAFDQIRFQALFDSLNESAGRGILPTDKRAVTILLDESDFTIGDKRTEPATVSSGANKKAADAELVKQANMIIKELGWVDPFGNVVKAAEQYLTNAKDEAMIGISEKGFEEIGRRFFRGKAAAVPKNLHERLRIALVAHKFYIKYKHYEMFMGGYIFRDPSNGRLYPGMQFDSKLHKALLAKEGKTVTDPGLSSVSIMPHVFLQKFEHVVLFSGSNYPMAKYFGQDGYYSLPIESNFPRTRVDFPAVMVGGAGGRSAKDVQLKMVVDWNIERLLEGSSVLTHVAQVGKINKKTGKAEETKVLTIKELKVAIEARLQEIRDYKGEDRKMLEMQQKLKEAEEEIGRRNQDTERAKLWPKGARKDRILIQELTDLRDVKAEGRVVALVGYYGVATLSDTANRAVDPGREVLARLKDGFRQEKGTGPLVSIITEIKTSNRHFIQEANRICRPVAGVGRAEGDMIAIYQTGDPNFKDEQAQAFMEKAILSKRAGTLVRAEVFPRGHDAQKVKDQRIRFAEFMVGHNIFSKEERDAYIKDGTVSSQNKESINLMEAYFAASDEKLSENLWKGSKANEAEELLTKLDADIKDIAENSKRSFAELLEPQMIKAAENATARCGISDTANWGKRNVLLFLKIMKRRYGLSIKIDGNFTTAFQLKEAVESAIKAKFKPWRDKPETGNQKRAIAAKLMPKVTKMRTWLISVQDELKNPAEFVVAERGSKSDILSRALPDAMENLISEQVAGGPDTAMPKLERELVNGELKLKVKMNAPRAFNKGPYYLGVTGIRIKAPVAAKPGTPEHLKYVEGLLKSKFKKIVKNSGNINPDYELIEIERVKYQLNAEGIKALNAWLAAKGSIKRVHIEVNGGKVILIIFGDTIPVEEVKGYRIITFTSEDAATAEDMLGFIGHEKRTAYGDVPKHEIIIRRKVIATVYDSLAEANFGAGYRDANPVPAAYAELLFNLFPEIKDAETAAKEPVKAKIVKLLEQGTVSHEKGHQGAFVDPLPERPSQYKYLSNGFVDSLYEVIAEFHPNGRLGEIFGLMGLASTPEASLQAKVMLYEYLFTQCQTSNPIKKKIYEALYRNVVSAGKGVDLSRLEQFRRMVYTLVKETFSATVKELEIYDTKLQARKAGGMDVAQKIIGIILDRQADVRRAEFSEAIDSMTLDAQPAVKPAQFRPPLHDSKPELKIAAQSVSDGPEMRKPRGDGSSELEDAVARVFAEMSVPEKQAFSMAKTLSNAKIGVIGLENGVFDGVEEGRQESFVKRLTELGITEVEFGRGVRFANGGEKALDAFLTANAERWPKQKIVFTVETGSNGRPIIVIKYSLLAFNGWNLDGVIDPLRLNSNPLPIPERKVYKLGENGIKPKFTVIEGGKGREIIVSIKDSKIIRQALASAPSDKLITFRSAETLKVRADAGLVRAWVASEAVLREILVQIGMVSKTGEMIHPDAAVNLFDVLSRLPESIKIFAKKPILFKTLSGGKGRISFVKGEVVLEITTSRDSAFAPLKIKISVATYKKIISGKVALRKIIGNTVPSDRNINKAEVRALIIDSIKKFEMALEALEGGYPVVSVDIPLIEITGTRAELESELLKSDVEVEIEPKRKVKAELFNDDIHALALSVPGSKEYEAALSNIKKSLVEQGLSESDAKIFINKVIRSSKLALISSSASKHFQGIAEIESLKVLNRELAKIDSEKMSPKTVEKAKQMAIARAQKAFTVALSIAQARLSERAQELDMATLSEAEVKDVYYDVAAKVRAEADKIPGDRFDAEVKAIAGKFNLDPTGKGFKARMDFYSLNAPGGTIKIKAAALRANIGKMALMGFVLEAPFAIYRDWNKKNPALSIIKEMAHGGYGWAKFETLNRAAQMSMGLKAGRATAVAMTLQTLWDVSSAKKGECGAVMVNGAVGLGGFLGLSHLAGFGLKFVPGIPSLAKEMLSSGLGILGATLASTGFEKAMDNFEWLNKAVNSKEISIAGDAGKFISPSLTAIYIGRVGTYLLPRIGLGRLVGLLKGGLVASAAWKAFTYGTNDASEAASVPRKFSGDIFAFANSGKHSFVHPREEMPAEYPAIDYKFYPEDFLRFQIAVMLHKQGRLFIEESPYFSEMVDVLHKVDFSNGGSNDEAKKIREAFAEYRTLLKKDSHYCELFANRQQTMMRRFINDAWLKGFVDYKMPADVQAHLAADYGRFVDVFIAKETKKIEAAKAAAIKSTEEAAVNIDKAIAQTKDIFAGYDKNLLAAIKKIFAADNRTALKIFGIIVNGQMLSAAAEQIKALLKKEIPAEQLKIFVEKTRLQRSAFKKTVEIKRKQVYASIVEQLQKIGYIDYLSNTLHIKKEDISKCVSGKYFQEAFFKFLTQKLEAAEESLSKTREKLDEIGQSAMINGKMLVMLMPKEIRAKFIGFLRENHPGAQINGADSRYFSQGMALLLISGKLAK
ncbi:hypothetical protein HZC34_06970 [Candidatus Saganbacteria bacterium]|nr:hypothetical protein [Candidatus Saganbacteria bacterium]